MSIFSDPLKLSAMTTSYELVGFAILTLKLGIVTVSAVVSALSAHDVIYIKTDVPAHTATHLAVPEVETVTPVNCEDLAVQPLVVLPGDPNTAPVPLELLASLTAPALVPKALATVAGFVEHTDMIEALEVK